MKLRELDAQLLAIPGFKDGFEQEHPYFDLALEIGGLRADLDMTQTEFGRLIGAPQSTIARLESGTQAPSVATLKRIAQATGTELVIEFRRPKRKRRAKHPRQTSSSASNARPTEPVAASGGDDPRGGSDR